MGQTWDFLRRRRHLGAEVDAALVRKRQDTQSSVRLEATGDPAFATDGDGRIVTWNQALEKLLGYTADAVVGKSCWEVLCGRDVFGNPYCHEFCSAHQSLLRNEPVCSFEFDVRQASGSFVRAVCSSVVVHSEVSAQSIIVHILRPVTQGTAAKDDCESSFAGTDQARKISSRNPKKDSELTGRQREILCLLADGWTNRSVAKELGISIATVRTHASHILLAFGVHNLRQAIAVARRRGVI